MYMRYLDYFPCYSSDFKKVFEGDDGMLLRFASLSVILAYLNSREEDINHWGDLKKCKRFPADQNSIGLFQENQSCILRREAEVTHACCCCCCLLNRYSCLKENAGNWSITITIYEISVFVHTCTI